MESGFWHSFTQVHFPRKLPEKTPTVPSWLDLKWRKESNSEKQRGYWRINNLNLSKDLPYGILLGAVVFPVRKKFQFHCPLGLLPLFGKRETPKPNKDEEDEKQPVVIRAQQLSHYRVPFKPKIP